MENKTSGTTDPKKLADSNNKPPPKMKPIYFHFSKPGLAVIAAMIATHTPCTAQTTGFFMGFSSGTRIGQVWSVQADGTRSLFYDTGITNGINGLGYDQATGFLYFSYGASNLNIARVNIFDTASGFQNMANIGTALGLSSPINGADFYDGEYYFIENDTQQLRAYNPDTDSFRVVDRLRNGGGDPSQWRLGDLMFAGSSLTVSGDDFSQPIGQTDAYARYSISNINDGSNTNVDPFQYTNNGSVLRFNGVTTDPSGNRYGYSTDTNGFYRINNDGTINSLITTAAFFGENGDLTNFVVPEPSSSMLGLLGIGFFILRRKR